MKFTQLQHNIVPDRQRQPPPWQCTNGFPMGRFDDLIESGFPWTANFNSTILIPDMKFTCSGTIRVRVIVAGMLQQNGNESTRLQIWRKNSIIHDIELKSMCDTCNTNTISQISRGKDERTLRMNVQISVESGDILGIDLPPRDTVNFKLYFINSTSTTNYIFQRNLSSPIDLSSGINETTVQPLIRIEIDQGI